MNRSLRITLTLVVSSLAVAYIVTKIDLRKTIDILSSASVPWVIASAVLTLVTVPPMAWRWQRLLDVRGVHESVAWLTRTYFVSYAWSQILPTSVGGDASRIFETSRRHPGRITPITGSVLLERSIGGAVTLLLAGIGFLFAIGRYSIGAYLWPEAIFVVAENLTEDAPPQPAACINDLREADECVLRLYERSADGALHYPCILPNGVVSSSPCAAGWPNDDSGKMRLGRVDNAISADGSRVFWTSYTGTPRNGAGKIYVRENANQPRSEECADASKACTIAVSGKAEEESGTSASRYWGAAKDGSKAIFTTGEDLYEFDVNAKTTHLIAHEVAGVMGASEDASYIYFASREDLDLGGSATAGEPNLYLYHGGSFSFVAALAKADISGDRSPVAPEPRRHQARVSGDGLHAAFMSFAAPTGYDNKDAVNAKTAAEVYLYEASASGGAGRLICASCNPSGARPVGANVAGHGAEYWAAARIPVWENTLYAARALSPDGKHLYFTSSDALSPRDTNGRQDVYQWEEVGTGGCEAADPDFVPSSGGCLSLISTGKSAKDSEFVEASPSGDDVFFSTLSSLVPQDYGLVDIYDARVGGGFPPPPPEKAECEGEACQSPAAPPQAPTPSSSTFEGAGNVKAGRCAKGRHKVRSAGRSRCVKANKKQKQKHKQGRAQR